MFAFCYTNNRKRNELNKSNRSNNPKESTLWPVNKKILHVISIEIKSGLFIKYLLDYNIIFYDLFSADLKETKERLIFLKYKLE